MFANAPRNSSTNAERPAPGPTDGANPTAGQQSNAKSDRELTRKIRQELMKDKDLSTYAHNVKVITKDGAVTLRGPVRSEDEKKAVETKAAQAGAASITNDLEVAPPKSHKEKKTS